MGPIKGGSRFAAKNGCFYRVSRLEETFPWTTYQTSHKTPCRGKGGGLQMWREGRGEEKPDVEYLGQGKIPIGENGVDKAFPPKGE